MIRTRKFIAGIAFGCVVIATQAQATESVTPPAEWASYVAKVRKAEAVKNDEARCLAYPDLPGNKWRQGAAKGRCSLLRKPMLSLDQVDRLLASDEGVVELDRRFAAALDAHYQDPAQRDQVFVAFKVFDGSARAGKVAERWLEAAPRSAFANAAAGTHYSERGWKARGQRFISQTSEADLKRMGDGFSRAVPLYLTALDLEPRLSVACVSLAAIGRQSSDALQQFGMDRCLKMDPDSYHVVQEWLNQVEPRWGGSDAQLAKVVAYAAARTERSPALGVFLGASAGYRPSVQDYGRFAEELGAAARMGPSAGMAKYAGEGFSARNDTWRAFAYLSQAIRFRPDDPQPRYSRAMLFYNNLKEFAWARADMDVALRAAPNDPDYNYQQARNIQKVKDNLAARPYFKRAMSHPVMGEWATAFYCESFIFPQFQRAEADRCTKDAVAKYPYNGEVWRLRAWTLYLSDQPGLREAVDQFARHAETSAHVIELDRMRHEWQPRLGPLPAGPAR
ncbi:DUF4034 domain-containing protein [Lysobacter sp. LF1]|uniref:DUF4034 domain-containing protein n=1 Tax=Lysobacter stagni TaxID=3045172 RepID=A0ABT6XHD6_9GAMM|nr:DUF4034 domain-containing protein [Lysobacter sp. LF1]MDI9239567.1 DUF4034 domain-containing protein [Lysobacter sp. LF1]